ncbi:MAG: hypothetical protein FWH53_07655 [Leptospirales bacterium]|nr:hypothetical protein [Leptospirales bacterium]
MKNNKIFAGGQAPCATKIQLKMKNNKILYMAILSVMILFNCQSTEKSITNETEIIKANELLSKINSINNSSPQTISSSFIADGNTGEKKFRMDGKVVYDKNGYYKITMIDYVFQSPIIEAYREFDELYFFYPSEKRLVVDDINKIDLTRYTGFKSDYKMIYSLLTGNIPLISNYKVYKCLYSENEKGYYLILENKECYQNIFFKDDMPEKILIIYKDNKSKFEIYLKSPIKTDKSIFFKSFRIIATEINTTININFIKPTLNKAVSVERLNRNKLPKKTEIIRLN